MALPKLNDMPKFSVTIPSLNEEIRIRPFVVKEEKVLLIAMESNDPKQIAMAIIDTIVSCTEGKIDPNKLTSYDVEYIFMQIRCKSVGETTDIRLKCKECESENDVTVNINEIKINTEVPDKRIQLTDKITIEMKLPTYLEIAGNDKIVSNSTSTMDQIFGIICQSIDCVMTEEERISFKEIKHEEQIEFVESMSREQFDKVRVYMESQPMLRHKIEFECQSCSKHNEYTLEGLQDFF